MFSYLGVDRRADSLMYYVNQFRFKWDQVAFSTYLTWAQLLLCVIWLIQKTDHRPAEGALNKTQNQMRNLIYTLQLDLTFANHQVQYAWIADWELYRGELVSTVTSLNIAATKYIFNCFFFALCIMNVLKVQYVKNWLPDELK